MSSRQVKKSEKWISASDAAIYLKMTITVLTHRIEDKTIMGRINEDTPVDADGHTNYEVLVASMPQKAQYRYYLSHLDPDKTYSTDLVTPTERFGDAWLKEHINVTLLAAEAVKIRRDYRGTRKITAELKKLCERHGITLTMLYRLEGKPDIVEVSKLWLDPIYLVDHLPDTMCLLSCDLAYYRFLSDEPNYSVKDIIDEFNKVTYQCTHCVYHEGSEERAAYEKKNIAAIYPLPVCKKERTEMLKPSNYYAVQRLIAHMPSQQICFCREGLRTWIGKYSHFLIRDRPMFVGSLFQGDNHVFDLFVRVTLRKTVNGKPMVKEVLARPSISCWLDTASNYVVGAVISLIPNASTIAEAFCRAVVYTVGDVAHSLPVCTLTDNGKDFRSALLQDIPEELKDDIPDDCYLNKRFAGNGLLPALNVKSLTSPAYYPQSKSGIERFFGTIERRWISKLPGWCRNSVANRPTDFQKELLKKWKEGELFSLEEFVHYFFNRILPEYHKCINLDEDTDIIRLAEPETFDPSDWHTAPEALSPEQKYLHMEKARDLTPTWKSMSLFKMFRRDNCKVYGQGILCKDVYYWSDELNRLIGEQDKPDKTVSILYNAGATKYDPPLSITVLFQGKYVCEAFPAPHYPPVGADKTEIAEEFAERQSYRKELRQRYERISTVIETCNLTRKEQFQREVWAPAIDYERDKLLGIDLTEDIIPSITDDSKYETNNENSTAQATDSLKPNQPSPSESDYDKGFSKADYNKATQILLGNIT